MAVLFFRITKRIVCTTGRGSVLLASQKFRLRSSQSKMIFRYGNYYLELCTSCFSGSTVLNSIFNQIFIFQRFFRQMMENNYQGSVLMSVWSHLNKALTTVYGWTLKRYPRVMSNIKAYSQGELN